MSEGKEAVERPVQAHPQSREILEGFAIDCMTLCDAETHEELWRTEHWDSSMFFQEREARIPQRILSCKSVARTIVFSSRSSMRKFRLVQRVLFEGACIEEWRFDFGFVIPGSTNEWEQTIFAAEPAKMLPAHLITGKIVIETNFFDGDLFVARNRVRVYYVE